MLKLKVDVHDETLHYFSDNIVNSQLCGLVE